ncbi:MAG: hypothetical protein V4594_08345 [Bacteroidota bacterium]
MKKTYAPKQATSPGKPTNTKSRAIVPVVRKVQMKAANDEQYDLEYWLGRSVKERAAAVTFIISQSLSKGQRMDKTKLVRKRM